MTQPPPAPGWYPDPSGQGQRYWDGNAWGPAAPAGSAPGPAAPPATAPAKKRRRWPWVLTAIVAVIVVASLANNGDKTGTGSTPSTSSSPGAAPASQPPSSAAPAGKSVTYKIESDGELSSVTYFDGLNDQKQITDAPSPWTTSFNNEATYPIYGVGAQTKGTHVSCEISINGKVRDTQSATGRFAVVNCTAT